MKLTLSSLFLLSALSTTNAEDAEAPISPLLCSQNREFCIFSTQTQSGVSLTVQAIQPSVAEGWIGFGFGTSMATATDMYIVTGGQEACYFEKRESTGHAEPAALEQGKQEGSFEEIVFEGEPTGGYECTFEIEYDGGGSENMIWAFGEKSEGGLIHHGENKGVKKSRNLFAQDAGYPEQQEDGNEGGGQDAWTEEQEWSDDEDLAAYDGEWDEDGAWDDEESSQLAATEGEQEEGDQELAAFEEDDDEQSEDGAWDDEESSQLAANEGEQEEGDQELAEDEDEEDEDDEEEQEVQSAAAMQSAVAGEASSGSSSSPTAVIGIVLSIFAFALIGLAGLLVWRRRRSRFHRKLSSSNLMEGSDKLGKMVVTHAYIKTLPDEIDLRVGDVVVVSAKYDDGWSKGLNESTGKRGSFPYVCLDGGLVKGDEKV